MTENVELINCCKYISDNKDVINGLFRKQKIRFTQPSALNDPLEFNPTIRYNHINNQYSNYLFNDVLLPSADDYFRRIYIANHVNRYGILSLTRRPDSFFMWNIYSNGHKGAVLVFKEGFNKHPCMLSPSGERYPLKKVDYEEEYSFKLDDLIPNDRDEIPIQEIFDNFFFKKNSRWSDECEWRIVRPIHDRDDFNIKNTQKIYLFDFSIDCIESIIFGAMMSVKNKILIKSHCNNYQISFWQAIIIRNEKDINGKLGKVYLIPEKSFKTDSSIYNLEPDSCILDKEHLTEKKIIPLKSISEHPYFAIDGEFFLNFYEENLKRKNT